MDTMLLRLFQRQVKLQCHAVLAAETRLHEFLTALSSIPWNDFAAREEALAGVWIGVQDMLNAAANISKAMWGQKGNREEERAPLRASVGLSSSSPLRQVTLRNHFEHFDERLDKWWATSKDHNYTDMNILPLPSPVSGIATLDTFRTLDQETMQVVFWGQEFPLQKIADAVRQLLPTVSIEAAKLHWDP